VGIFHPRVEEYEYTWQGQHRKGTTFVCDIVSLKDPRNYCQGHCKKTKITEEKFKAASKKFNTEGGTFVMSKVVFVDNAKQQYNNAPMKVVVDLGATRMEAVVASTQVPSAVQPAPTTTVSKCSELKRDQFFDVTALVKSCNPPQEHRSNRSSLQVSIYDGSLDETTKKVKELPLRLFFDTDKPERGHRFRQVCTEAMAANEAVTILCIKGSQDEQGAFNFASTRHTRVEKANPDGPKAAELNAKSELHNLTDEATTPFHLAQQGARDWSAEPGVETRCKLLASFAHRSTGLKDLDDRETVWQLNWVRVTEPTAEQEIKATNAERLWFQLPLRDHTGNLSLYITEQAALKLAGATDRADFEQRHLEERLQFPTWASIKVWRKPTKERSAAQPASIPHAQPSFDCYIVDATEQDLTEAPTEQSKLLLPLLDSSMDDGSGILPATLDMIQASDHYAMAVRYATQALPKEMAGMSVPTHLANAGATTTRPCSHVVALVASTEASRTHNMGTEGCKLVTKNVVDATFPDITEKCKYDITSYCTLATNTDFKLNPPRTGSKTQHALISISSVLATNSDSNPPGAGQPAFLVESVQLLQPSEVDRCRAVMRKMIYFTAIAGQLASRKRDHEGWTDDESPAKAAACRSLGRHPTGPGLPDYTPGGTA